MKKKIILAFTAFLSMAAAFGQVMAPVPLNGENIVSDTTVSAAVGTDTLAKAFLPASDTIPQEDQSGFKKAVPKLKYIKQPGLAHAASKIYTADQRFAISGFGEINSVNYLGPKNREGTDLELYYTNLYRSGTYFGYKFTDRLIFNSELQLELLHDGLNEFRVEANLEFIFDILLKDYLNVRIGNYPLPIGYVNINEEPIAFYTVNRPEVERILIPTQWLETGIMFYGNILPGLEYNLGATKGMDATGFMEGSWIRQGRFHRLGFPRTAAFNGKLEYSAIRNFQIGLSGYHGDASNRQLDPSLQPLHTYLTMASSFAQYSLGNFSLFALATRGWLSGTDQLYTITNRVIGAETFGYYGEARWNMMPLIKASSTWQVPLFIRYERLNTHAAVHASLEDMPREQNDLSIISIGMNVRPKRNIVFKTNYQIRNNLYQATAVPEANRFELGFGFIY